jgi:hypothetical protein
MAGTGLGSVMAGAGDARWVGCVRMQTVFEWDESLFCMCRGDGRVRKFLAMAESFPATRQKSSALRSLSISNLIIAQSRTPFSHSVMGICARRWARLYHHIAGQQKDKLKSERGNIEVLILHSPPVFSCLHPFYKT